MIFFKIALFLFLFVGLLLGCDTDVGGEPDTADSGGETEDSDTENGDTASYSRTGLCGTKAEAQVSAANFEGAEERYLTADEGDGSDLCRVRFTLRSIGPPPIHCKECEWAFELERSAPLVMDNVDDTCAESALSLGPDRIAAEAGTRVSWGYAGEATGHAHLLMILDEESEIWRAAAVAAWNETDGTFYVDRVDGYCGY